VFGCTIRTDWTIHFTSWKKADSRLVFTETGITTGSGVVHFILNNDNLWPTGSYKVNIYLNGELETTVEFVVQ